MQHTADEEAVAAGGAVVGAAQQHEAIEQRTDVAPVCTHHRQTQGARARTARREGTAR